MNTRFELENTWVGYYYLKGWMVKNIIDLLKLGNKLSPGQLALQATTLFALPAIKLTGHETSIQLTETVLDMLSLALDPIGMVTRSMIIHTLDLKLDEWWNALTDTQRSDFKTQETFALLHVLKLEGARKSQQLTNKMYDMATNPVIQEKTEQPAEEKHLPLEKKSTETLTTQQELTDPTKIENAARDGKKLYIHKRDQKGRVQNTRCTTEEAKVHLQNGGEVEVKSKHEKYWLNKKDMTKIVTVTEVITTTVLTQAPATAPTPSVPPTIHSDEPAPYNSRFWQLPPHQTATLDDISSSAENSLSDSDDEAQAEPEQQAPTMTIIDQNTPPSENISLPNTSITINSNQTLNEHTETVATIQQPTYHLEQRSQQLFDALIQTINDAVNNTPTSRHTLFSDATYKIQRTLQKIQKELESMRKGEYSMHDGAINIIYYSRSLRETDPICLAAKSFHQSLPSRRSNANRQIDKNTSTTSN